MRSRISSRLRKYSLTASSAFFKIALRVNLAGVRVLWGMLGDVLKRVKCFENGVFCGVVAKKDLFSLCFHRVFESLPIR